MHGLSCGQESPRLMAIIAELVLNGNRPPGMEDRPTGLAWGLEVNRCKKTGLFE